MSAALLAIAGVASVAVSVLSSYRNKSDGTNNNNKKVNIYETPRTYEPEYGTESPGYADQNWQRDCGQRGSCSKRPYATNSPPVHPIETLNESVGTLGDMFPDLVSASNRDASIEVEDEPMPTVTYTSNPLAHGPQLSTWDLPRGARESTDLEFWGKRDWEEERQLKFPSSWTSNRETEHDGKEINRPLDDFGYPQFNPKIGGAHVDFNGGETSAFDPSVMLMRRNTYGKFVTFTSPDRPEFLAPGRSVGGGGGGPAKFADVTLGGRLSRLYNDFAPWKGGINTAPPETADITFDQSKLIDWKPIPGLVNGPPGGKIYGTSEQNPYEGYHYTSRETEEGLPIGRSRMGGNGLLLLGPNLEYNARRIPDDIQEYISPRGGTARGVYAGEWAHGSMFPNVKLSPMSIETPIIGRGAMGKGLHGQNGLITLSSNMKHGLKGGDVDNSPMDNLHDLSSARSVGIIGGRTPEAFSDLFDVQHS